MTCLLRRKRLSTRALTAAALLLSLGLQADAAYAAQAADVDGQARLRTRSLAASCAHCHGTDGQAAQGQAMVKLAGLPADYMLAQLLAFRNGTRPATIMHQLAKGYTPEQLSAIATYFASQK